MYQNERYNVITQCTDWAHPMSLSAVGTQYPHLMPSNSFSPRARQLGAAMKAHRGDVGVRDLADRMGLNKNSHSLISLWEKGQRIPSPEEVASYATALGLDEGARQALVNMAKRAKEPNLVVPGVPEVTSTLMDIERSAAVITDVAPVKLVSGMLQIGDYARAIMGTAPGADTRVAMRLARADVLTRRNPVTFLGLLSEECLRQPIADADVMVAQLRHLLRMADEPAVTIQVIPVRTVGWRPGLLAPFEVVEFEKAPPIVHVEADRASSFLYEDEDTAVYRANARQLSESWAMSPEDSTKLIAEVIKETAP